MRIRPWIATVSVTAVAAAALGVVVIANEPATAPVALKVLFWAALATAGWGLAATVLLAVRCNLPQAAWSGLILSAGFMATLTTLRGGSDGNRLLGGIVFATLLLAFVVWYRLRGRTQ